MMNNLLFSIVCLMCGVVIGSLSTMYMCAVDERGVGVYSHWDIIRRTRVGNGADIHDGLGENYTQDIDNKDMQITSLYNQTRLLCWVMTYDSNLELKAKHINSTWGRRCDKLLFISDEDNDTFPAIGVNSKHGRRHLSSKTQRAFDYIYRNYFEEADWFLKADDDTYVIVDNLRHLLSAHVPSDAIYFGHPYKAYIKQGFACGGGGYVLSKEALLRYHETNSSICETDGVQEDVVMGRCLEMLNVTLGDSRDRLGRSRFHCLNYETYLHREFPAWYYNHAKYNPDKTEVSDYPISFHYVTPEQMHELEYFVYHLNVYYS